MQRTIFVVLGVGAIVTSAAAIGLATSQAPWESAARPYDASAASLEGLARNSQRAYIQSRYEIERARCDALRGAEHDRCVIDAHAMRGLALLEAAAPYQRKD